MFDGDCAIFLYYYFLTNRNFINKLGQFYPCIVFCYKCFFFK